MLLDRIVVSIATRHVGNQVSIPCLSGTHFNQTYTRLAKMCLSVNRIL